MKRLMPLLIFAGVLGLSSHGFGQAAAVQTPKKSDQATAKRVVAALERLGAKLDRDDQDRVRGIEATEGQLTDKALAWLPYLPHLESLEVTGGQITDDGIAQLRVLTSLQRLYLNDVPVTDAALAQLRKLVNLEVLSLQNTGVTSIPEVSSAIESFYEEAIKPRPQA